MLFTSSVIISINKQLGFQVDLWPLSSFKGEGFPAGAIEFHKTDRTNSERIHSGFACEPESTRPQSEANPHSGEYSGLDLSGLGRMLKRENLEHFASSI
jgi:hypothetical protein